MRAGRLATILLAIALLGMSILCFYWQRYSEAPLLNFALGVMNFAYSGLLGVYFTILFTRRGSSRSVMWALATGFLTIAVQQGYVVDMAGLPASWKSLAFPYQLCIGTAVAFATCLLGNSAPVPVARTRAGAILTPGGLIPPAPALAPPRAQIRFTAAALLGLAAPAELGRSGGQSKNRPPPREGRPATTMRFVGTIERRDARANEQGRLPR